MSYDRKPFASHLDLDLASALEPNYKPLHEFLTLAEIMELTRPGWLVKGLIPSEGIGVVYGRPGTGKTFFVLSVALSIGHGMSCFDGPPLQGNIALIAGEGAGGLQSRVDGWHKWHDLDWNTCSAVKILPHSINLLDAEGVTGLIRDIHHTFQGQPIAAVVIDTLARCFGDGDENRQADMARLVEAGELIRNAFNCAVIFVHHTPKEGDDLRGSNALEGACDFIIRLAKSENGMEAIIRKMKDGKDGFTHSFQMEKVHLGIDSENEPIETLVAVLEGELRENTQCSAGSGPAGKNQNAVLSVLKSAGDEGLTEDEWREKVKTGSVVSGANPNRAFREARQALVRDRMVVVEGNRFRAA